MSKQFRICLDAGHGNGNRTRGVFDPGAVAGGVREADVALDWVLALLWVGRNWFDVDADQIVLTRDDDSDYSPVGRRDDRAMAAGCSHFLSVHCNASVKPWVRGTETLFSEDRGRENSMTFADLVQRAAMGAMRSNDRGVKSERMSQHGDLAVIGKNIESDYKLKSHLSVFEDVKALRRDLAAQVARGELKNEQAVLQLRGAVLDALQSKQAEFVTGRPAARAEGQQVEGGDNGANLGGRAAGQEVGQEVGQAIGRGGERRVPEPDQPSAGGDNRRVDANDAGTGDTAGRAVA